jgi:hypothetical protein
VFSSTHAETTSSTFKETSKSYIATSHSHKETTHGNIATSNSLIEITQNNPATSHNGNIATGYSLKETTQGSFLTSYSHLQSAPTSMAPTHAPSCCLCNYSNTSLSSNIDHMINELKVDKTSLSSYKRTKISAGDDRVTSKFIGWLGGLILTLLFGFIVFLDVLHILKSASYFSKFTPD